MAATNLQVWLSAWAGSFFHVVNHRESTLADDLGNFGERQVAIPKGFGYFAHLSIYHYARMIYSDGPFLDVGCGSGYGCDFIRKSGAAQVFGVEREASVVDKLRSDYPGIIFDVCDLNEGVLPFDPCSMPFVFSSNVMEHVAYPDAAFGAIARILRPDGRALIAVPPIASPYGLSENAKNLFHITNLPYWCWQAKLSRMFEVVQPIRHWFVDEAHMPDNVREIYGLPPNPSPSPTALADFTFTPQPDGDLEHSLTAVFLCSQPRPAPLPPNEAERPPPDWRVLQVEALARQAQFTAQECAFADQRRVWSMQIAEMIALIDQPRAPGGDAEAQLKALRHRLALLG